MKFVIDMNLPPSWISKLKKSGFEAVHWSQVGKSSAKDSEIIAWAETSNFTVLPTIWISVE